MSNTKKAFTLIELLVVIAIIGILATVSVITLSNARAKARDAKRVGDVKQVQTALELFMNDKGRYPTAEEFNSGSIYSSSTSGTSTYMQIVPAASSPADGSCTSNQNTFFYTQTDNGNSYALSFCLGNTTGALASGPKCLTPGGILSWDCSSTSCLDDSTNCSWQSVGLVGFSTAGAEEPSLFIYDGVPYVAYWAQSNSRKVTVAKYTGQGTTGWENVGSPEFSAGRIDHLSLFISDDVPYVAFRDWSENYGATVMKYTGVGATGWESVGTPGFSAGVTDNVSFYISNNIPYVAYTDEDNGNGATVMKYTGVGATGWESVGTPGFSADRAEYLSLFVDSNTPYVSYTDLANTIDGRATVMKYTGAGASGWENVGAQGFSAGEAGYFNLRVYNNIPYVAYLDGGNSYNITVMKYTGVGVSGWEAVGGPGFSNGQSERIDLYFHNGVPFAAYLDYDDNYNVTVKKYVGTGPTGWEPLDTTGFSAHNASYTSFFAYNGTPYIAYTDYLNSGKINVIKFSR